MNKHDTSIAERRRRMVYESMLASVDIVTEDMKDPAPNQVKRAGRTAEVADLVDLLGARPTAALLHRWGGSYLPTFQVLVRYLRHECLRRDIERGFKNRHLLAAKYNIPRSQVDKAIAAVNRDMLQKAAEKMAGATDPEEPLVCRIDGSKEE